MRVEVAIVGGGLVGAGLAAWLADAGVATLVIERARARPFRSLGRDCRVSAITRGVELALDQLGAWPAEHAAPIESMRIWDDQHPGGLRLDAAEIGEPRLGAVVENSVLLDALRAKAIAAGAAWLDGAPARLVVGAKSAYIELDDGRRIEARLVVGADGARSWTREAAGIGCWLGSYGQRGIVATVEMAEPLAGSAYQRFLPDGPLALLPLAGARMASIVWSCATPQADARMRLDDAAFAEALLDALGPVAGGVRRIGARAAFPLERRLARRLVRPRLALVGDAAHVIHPLAGLGVNLGFRDALVLAEEIVQARRFGEDPGDLAVLARYRDRRLPDVSMTMAAMEGFHRLFTLRLPGLGRLRAAGMTAFGQLAPLKRMLMRQAAGLAVDVPRAVV